MAVSIAHLSVEHHHDGFGIFTPTPRLSWRFNQTTVKSWRQTSYDVEIYRGEQTEGYHVESPSSVLVPWPSSPLVSREQATIKVRAHGTDNISTEWISLGVEVALLDRSDWSSSAKLISGPAQGPAPKRPFLLRKKFHCTSGNSDTARLYATAHGVYEVEINGHKVGDQIMAPGWQTYHHHLHYQVYDIAPYLQEGNNVIGVHVAEGWYATRLGRPGVPNHWGDRLAFLGQLEINGETICVTNATWEHLDGPLLLSELYNGEVYDTNLSDPSWSTAHSTAPGTGHAQEVGFPTVHLIAPDLPPIQRIMEIKPKEVFKTPTGKMLLDFGQNFVGWLRIEKDIKGESGDNLVIRHAEVLEHGELGTRPLRSAAATYTVKLGGPTKGLETKFTFYGFRYAEIIGYDSLSLNDFTGIVIASDLRRTGTFQCSHKHINRLHENAVWSMRGNFISIPTDCPQRDEKLGWTGDIQVFAPTANFLFDTSAFLGSWLRDLYADQKDADGVVPVIIPNPPKQPDDRMKRPMAIWADCAVITPFDLYTAYGDKAQLEAQWESMCLWLDKGLPRDERGFWSSVTPQYGDWLDPRSAPNMPGNSPTDSFLVANAYLIHTTKLAAQVAAILGKTDKAEQYAQDATRLTELFQNEYVTPNGRLACDTQTTYALALKFNLLAPQHIATARDRLAFLVRWDRFQINTGFAGTPIILQTLADNGSLNLAYRMLQEADCPSWLYPVRMGATTIWERWNSMLDDGSINTGQMTSFNHYALGSVCAFLHNVVGGLAAAEPGWRKAIVRPRPGGTVRTAKTRFESPLGVYEVDWVVDSERRMRTRVVVPPNGEARVVLDGVDEVVGSGEYVFETGWVEEGEWPPSAIRGPQKNVVEGSFVP
ncbi:bacterial alpha-L-rhamnosidase-domain-containing protein [Aspergillus karnatakaensis]|uniref:bacterial alpha-L-rhamnosidase-domain-containing protein n=1 Tax=Aspergillus karnatakaensis TaxID=1810916 RepID=UPI003CCE1522